MSDAVSDRERVTFALSESSKLAVSDGDGEGWVSVKDDALAEDESEGDRGEDVEERVADRRVTDRDREGVQVPDAVGDEDGPENVRERRDRDESEDIVIVPDDEA